MIWFSADSHYFHKAIIGYCQRNYASVEEMNEGLINNWNSVVASNDTVYHIGDFGFGKLDKLIPIFKRLNGQKILIRGNHDKDSTKLPWAFIKDGYELRYKDKVFILHHFPYLSWDKQFYGSINIHGHVHGKQLQSDLSVLRFDVGVDANNYTPVSIDIIVDIVNSQKKATLSNAEM